ncbi:anaerobic ribonucleoside-triphosphate reductase activating protein [Lachnospiraceae bacterium HCP1S3_C3]|nr:anaerobic ribonucleoside-triphosphate reductase activating protein [Lachnospiraceae bacterium]MDD6858085.1 anaerobic ribonucleoside-triphosphate reductase activating protein [Lachnospiraceae bacterium]
MNYADIKQYDVANGPGIRISLFVSGCTHHCKECFNPETWDFNYGKPFTQETIDLIIEYMKPEFISGLTLLGGDPFEIQNQEPLIPLLKQVKSVYPDKTVWCFTGYDFERDIVGRMMNEYPFTKELLSYIDVMVDGEFILEQKDLSLIFKGSANQKTIKVKESLESGTVQLYEFDTE